MKIHNMPQTSPEWFAIRAKKMTASHAQEIQANGKGLKTYVTKLMQEWYSSAEPEQHDNEAMQRGRELEDSAAFVYQMDTGNEVQKVGFVEFSLYVGASPDLFVGSDGMAEIKCPGDKVYFQLLLDGKIDPKYMAQMQMQIYCCGKKWCDYVVYNPNFDKKIVIIRVLPDDNIILKLIKGFDSGVELMKEIESKMESLNQG